MCVFLQETEGHGVTPVQCGALQAVCNAPGLDPRTLARAIDLVLANHGLSRAPSDS